MVAQKNRKKTPSSRCEKCSKILVRFFRQYITFTSDSYCAPNYFKVQDCNKRKIDEDPSNPKIPEKFAKFGVSLSKSQQKNQSKTPAVKHKFGPEDYDCTFCYKSFDLANSLRSHVKIDHKMLEIFVSNRDKYV